MSSSSIRRRPSSIRSFDSNRKPKWLSPSAQPATSISRVFAQPLQGSPLRSAIDTVADLDDVANSRDDEDMARKRERTPSTASLDTPTTNTAQPDDAGSNKRSRLDSLASQKEEAMGVESSSVDPVREAIPTTTSLPPLETPPPPAPPVPVSVSPTSPTQIPFPAAPTMDTVKPPSSAKSPPKSTSWFGSFSRAATKAPSSESLTTAETEQTCDKPMQDRSTCSSTPPQLQPDSLTRSPVSESHSPPACASSSQLDVTPRPATPLVDDTVASPDINAVEPCSSEQLSALKPNDSPPTISTPPAIGSNPNSSTSRFTLRIPLLGRAKVPLEQAISASSSSAGSEQPSPDASRTGGPESVSINTDSIPQVVVSSETEVDLAKQADTDILNNMSSPSEPSTSQPVLDGLVSPSGASVNKMDTVSTPLTAAPSESGSWWGYVGWYSSSGQLNESSSTQTSPNGEVEQTDAGAAAAPAEEAQVIEAPSISPTAQLSPGAQSTTSISSVEPPESSQHPERKSSVGQPEKRQTASLFSADTLKSQSSGSAWYSPWAWYAASPIVPSPSSMPPPVSDSQSTVHGEDEENMGHQKTESEMVKEQALARDDGAEGSGGQANQEILPKAQSESGQEQNTDRPVPERQRTMSAPTTPSNPIESTIESQRIGWASFFMSKALLMKSVTDGQEAEKRDENGMEVMDIDDDPVDNDPKEVVPAVSDTKETQEARRSLEVKEVKEVAAPSRTNATPAQSKAITIVAGRGKVRQPVSLPSSLKSKGASPPPTPKTREPKKPGTPAPPLTESDSIKKETAKSSGTRPPSPTPSKTSVSPPKSQPPNLVLPTWEDTFKTQPRSNVPPQPTPVPTQKGKISKTLSFVGGILFSGKEHQEEVKRKGKERERERERDDQFLLYGQELPKALDVVGQAFDTSCLNDKCRVVILGVAGWSPGAVTRTIAGGLPSSSSKFVNMTCSALEKFEEDHGFKFQKVTKIPLEGDGTIERKVAKVHAHLMSNDEWLSDLHAADVIFVATHSQGSIVSTHLLDKLIREGHIMTEKNVDILATAAAAVAPGGVSPPSSSTLRTQKICCLALCGIHLGPLRYLRTSSLLQPYIQYFENAAARELFDFQNTETEVSRNYVKALNTVMEHGTKMVYVASLNDQVVPIYSGLFTAASHPRILRALYIDGDAYSSSDFLSNLLVLLLRIMNSGLSDSGLLAHLSEATAGTLSGVGHSTAYEELATYSLAVDYLFLATDGGEPHAPVTVEPFNAVNEQNDYEIPWSLRDLIADERVARYFAHEFAQLRDAFDDWAPKTTILRDIKRKLQPIQRLSSIKVRGGPLGSRL